jgi:hypothetical protein
MTTGNNARPAETLLAAAAIFAGRRDEERAVDDELDALLEEAANDV